MTFYNKIITQKYLHLLNFHIKLQILVSKLAQTRTRSLTMDDVYNLFKPLLSFLKVLGLYPLTFKGPLSDKNSSIKWHDWILPIINASVVLYLSCTYLLTLHRLESVS